MLGFFKVEAQRLADREKKRERYKERGYVPVVRTDSDRSYNRQWMRNFRARRFVNLKLCGLCGNRRSICNVTRLRIHNGAFEKITVPYCGQC